MSVECRVMFTRKCPVGGCEDLPCARFESEDASRWSLDQIEWEKASAILAVEAAAACNTVLDRLKSNPPHTERAVN